MPYDYYGDPGERHVCPPGDAELREKVQRLELQAGEARKLLIEFTTDAAVCLAIASRCIGGHQEDPCKCLYCRTRQQIFEMDEVTEKPKGTMKNPTTGNDLCQAIRQDGLHCWADRPCPVHG